MPKAGLQKKGGLVVVSILLKRIKVILFVLYAGTDITKRKYKNFLWQ